MDVFAVELREQHPGNPIWEITGMHVASTKEKAIAWAQLPENVAELKLSPPYGVYAICRDVVDEPSVASGGVVAFVGRDGVASGDPPEYFFTNATPL
jgi:hypothetical protein